LPSPLPPPIHSPFGPWVYWGPGPRAQDHYGYAGREGSEAGGDGGDGDGGYLRGSRTRGS